MKPRVTIHKNGNATLSGIPQHMLKSILTWAALHYYETDAKSEPKDEHYRETHKFVLDRIEDSFCERYYYKSPTLPLIDRLRENNRIRKMLDEIIEKGDTNGIKDP